MADGWARFLTYRHPFLIGQSSPLDSYITSYLLAQGSFIALMMEAACNSETSVDIDLTTQQYIPEDSALHTRRSDNLKPHRVLQSFEIMIRNLQKRRPRFSKNRETTDNIRLLCQFYASEKYYCVLILSGGDTIFLDPILIHLHELNTYMIFPPECGVGLVPKRGCLLKLAYYAFPK
jgi:hypothetical protein